MSWSAKQMNMRWVNSRMYTFTSRWLDFHYIISVFVCVFRCVITAPLAGCPLMLKPISWVSVQLWPSEDFSSTSLEPMKEVMHWQKLFGGKKSTINGFSDRVRVCAGIQMEMTAPVLVKIPEETKMWEPAVYTLNFPLPAAYQDKPPVPTNDKVNCALVVRV